MVVLADQLLDHVLANPTIYKGEHNKSHARTSDGLQPLDKRRQLQLIWDAMVAYLTELLQKGESVSIQGFGCFTFETRWLKPAIGPDLLQKTPTFVPDNKLKAALRSYHGKEKVNMDVGALSTSQAVPAKVRFLNEVPIAAGCYYDCKVVKSAKTALFGAIVNLCSENQSLLLDFGNIAKFTSGNGTMKMQFAKEFVAQFAEPARVQGPGAQIPGTKLSDTWKTPAFAKSMTGFVEVPNEAHAHAVNIATQNLGVMGRDLTSVQNP